MNFGKYFDRYVVGVFSYGIVRKALQVQDATIECYDKDAKKKKRIPILWSDKIALTFLGGLTAVTVWPMYMYNDVRHIEVSCRKPLDPSWYDVREKTGLHDYVFS